MLLVGDGVKHHDITDSNDNHGNGNRSYSENITHRVLASNKLNEDTDLHLVENRNFVS